MAELSCDDVIASGELAGAGHDGRSGAGQGGLCEAADRERSEHPSLPDDSSPGGAVQHGEVPLTTCRIFKCGCGHMV